MKRARRHWLFKTEPSCFSFDDLWTAKERRSIWDGVRNYQARNLLRDEVQSGDGVLIYHSSTRPPHVAGIAWVCEAGLVDPSAFEPAHPQYDPRSTPEQPRWFTVRVEALCALPRLLTLAQIRANAALAGLPLLQRGQRLSIQPVDENAWLLMLEMAGLGVEEIEAAIERSWRADLAR